MPIFIDGKLKSSSKKLKSSSKKLKSSSRKRKREEPPSVLLITTHGGYQGPSMEQFKSPMNIKKINAVTLGICNYLGSYSADTMGKEITREINRGKITDMVNGSEKIGGILKQLDLEIRRPKGNDEDGKAYTRVSDRSYQIISIALNSSVLDRTYTVYPGERSKSHTPYFDTVTLLTDDTHNDLIQEMVGRTYRAKLQNVKLSDILEYLHKKRKINNLIIADLSCSVTDLDPRTIRSLTRTGGPHNIGYKQKKRSKKKPKKPKKPKVKGRKTKRLRK
jgi:hypothetical protein